jgi:hypothetical protein
VLVGCRDESPSPTSIEVVPAGPAAVVSPGGPGYLYLHGSGGTANPPTLFLDANAPTAGPGKYKDSPSVKFSAGNPYKEVGTWTAAAGAVNGQLTGFDDAHVWVGLKNGDDVGTRFDLRVEAYKNGVLISSGQFRCQSGLAVNPNQAQQVTVTLGALPPTDFNSSDVFSLKVLTRIGTTPSGTLCGGHSNAVGLRVYFDGSRNARVRLLLTETGGGDFWTTQASMPTARGEMGTAALGNTLYAIGGNSGAGPVASVEAYDAGTNTWSEKTSLPVARTNLGAAVINGTVYAVGGSTNSGKAATLEAYDPLTNSWSTKAPMPTARGYAGTAALNGTLYVVGGFDDVSALRTVEAYDPGTNTWSTKAQLPVGRHSVALAALNGVLYAVGGGDNEGIVATVDAYDPGSNSWSPKAPMQAARYSVGLAVIDGVLYAVGGEFDGSEGLATVEAYNPNTDSWSPRADMPTARYAPGAAAINGVLYAVGGFNYTLNPNIGALRTLEAYHP